MDWLNELFVDEQGFEVDDFGLVVPDSSLESVSFEEWVSDE